VAEREKKAEPAATGESAKSTPVPKDDAKTPVAADSPKTAVPLPPLRNEKKISVAVTPEVKPPHEAKSIQKSKGVVKISRKEPDRKAAERSDKKREAEHRGKQHEKDARSHKEREKTAHVDQKRRKVIQEDKPRIVRAGSDESRRPIERYVGRRSDTRFTEIWTERR
jgi:hypothetical protein